MIRPELIDEFNLKDLQTLLETFVAYELITYSPSLVDRITQKVIKELGNSNKGGI